MRIRVRTPWLSEEEVKALRTHLDPDLVTAIEKAVAAHPSHVQQRTREGQFRPFNFRAEAPRDTAGRFVKRLTAEEMQEAKRLAEQAQQQYRRQLGYHLEDCQKGRLTAEEATTRGRGAIEEYYERLFRHGLQGAGNPGIVLTARDRAWLSRTVKDEGDYWAGFMADVEGQRGKMPYPERLSCYIAASQEVYWAGWVFGDVRPKRKIRWVVGPTEHCTDCLEASHAGWMPVQQFIEQQMSRGRLPQSGYLECRGLRCQCRLEDI